MAIGWPVNLHFLSLFGSIDGAAELACSRNKIYAKNRKIGLSQNICDVIYTYSTVLTEAMK